MKKNMNLAQATYVINDAVYHCDNWDNHPIEVAKRILNCRKKGFEFASTLIKSRSLLDAGGRQFHYVIKDGYISCYLRDLQTSKLYLITKETEDVWITDYIHLESELNNS